MAMNGIQQFAITYDQKSDSKHSALYLNFDPQMMIKNAV